MNALSIISTVLCLLSAPAALAQSIEYRSIEPLKEQGKGFRDSWDSTKQFCFKSSDQPDKTCFAIAGMGEIKLRDGGEWNQEPASQTFISNLGVLRVEAEKYDRVFVRYLALGSGNQFVVHVFFVPKGSSSRSSQTIFAMGEIRGANAVVTAMSFSSAMEEFGATFGAVAALRTRDTAQINAYIVEQNLSLLKIGQSVVTTYLSQIFRGPLIKILN